MSVFNAAAFIRDTYLNLLADAVYNSNVLTWWLIKQNRVKWLSGNTFHWNVLFAKATGGGAYAKGGAATYGSVDNIVQASMYLKNYWQPIQVEGEDLNENQGEAAVGNWLESQVANAEETLRDLIGDDIHGTSTGDSSVLTLCGLQAGIDSGATYGTYADLSRTTYPLWGSKLINHGGAEVTELLLQRAYNEPVQTGTACNLALTTKNIFTKIQNLLAAKNRNMVSSTLAQALFTNVVLGNGVPIVRDDKCPSGLFYFLNTRLMWLAFSESCKKFGGFEMKKFAKDPSKINTYISEILTHLAMFYTSPRHMIKITNIKESFS